jgi:hypothetical protein
MKRIPLTQGKYAIVDDEDYEQLCKIKWCYHVGNNPLYGYAVTNIGKRPNRKQIRLHRFLLKPTASQMIDHKNGNTLDNRRSNIRICTRLQNSMNQKPRNGSKSSYKGVSFVKKSKRNPWLARIKINGNTKILGVFNNIEAAAEAFQKAEIKYRGEFAYYARNLDKSAA